MAGYISLHRKIKDNILFKENRVFSKLEAWIDILMDCNFKENDYLLWYETIKIPIWSYITSKQKLYNKYNWSKWKLNNYLKLLEKQWMIKIKTVWKWTCKATQLYVLNYTTYQNNEPTIEPKTTPKQATTKKVKNKYWEYKNILLTQNEKNKLIEDYWESIFNDYIKILDEWIEMKWYKYKNHNLAIRNWIKRDKWESSVTSWISNDYEKQKAERLARYWIKD